MITHAISAVPLHGGGLDDLLLIFGTLLVIPALLGIVVGWRVAVDARRHGMRRLWGLIVGAAAPVGFLPALFGLDWLNTALNQPLRFLPVYLEMAIGVVGAFLPAIVLYAAYRYVRSKRPPVSASPVSLVDGPVEPVPR